MEIRKLGSFLILISFYFFTFKNANAQLLKLPDGGVNLKCKIGRSVGVTDIDIKYNAPGVKGREGHIWGTSIAPFGFSPLGFGSNMPSPWRAGANECTTISFSTDVKINGKAIPAGNYSFFIALYPDSCNLIFNKNSAAWGAYFYKKELDVLTVTTRQQKDRPKSNEFLEYTFSNQTDHSVEVALEWEKWRIPFNVEIDLMKTTLASIQQQMSGAMGFDPASLEAAANWCLTNNLNFEEALNWISSATDPNLGGKDTFAALSTKAGILNKLGKAVESEKLRQTALETANKMELHAYGRQLIVEKRANEAMAIFEKNYKKYNGEWPTNTGMMRGYSAIGNLKSALTFAKKALSQAPNPINKSSLEDCIKTLEAGKAL